MMFCSFTMKVLHPLVLGVIMLFFSIMISINLNIFNKSSIYSMMMFLIIIGGFLILFMYFNSFALNNKMILNNNMLIKSIYNVFLISLMTWLIIYKNNLFNMILFLNQKLFELMPIMKMNFYKNETNINLIYMKFYYLTLFLMIYLLYTLIIIVKIIYYLNPKSMRQLIN
uniref:NADH dehydrogenase subunit 6 n=1 Tax=Dryocosmus liui TaxID=2315263 RepID=UPI0022653CE2|nr:NADH dehydrogenase subunit 6 [Dryocosmus liui]UEE83323.1 NADH dehydrogenase subunit 6 [Dryocosmus liui]